MRRLSIKARVTIWYTGLVAALLMLGVGYLFSFSGVVFGRQLTYKLQDAVSDMVQKVDFNHGELEEEELDFYKEGISLFIYDTKGHLLAPRINRGIQVDSILEDQAVKQVRMGREIWMVHDLYAEKEDVGFWIRGIVSTSEVTITLQSMVLLAICAIPIMVIIAAFGGWLITQRAFAVVGEMAKTAEAITSGEDLSLRLPNDLSGDEVSRLSSTMNVMLGRLQNSFERERQFTSDTSHELRTPVAIIISQCEYGIATEDEEERKDALQAILRQGNRMSTLLSQLLLLARADSGRFQLNLETINFSELCEMTIEELEERAEQAQVKLCCHLEENVMIQGDETLLIRLLTNLISNAIQYNKIGGKVVVSLVNEAGNCLLKVEDTGKGIGKEEQEKIWHRFYRGDSSRSSEGTGLGLSMVRWICEIHKGSIRVESEEGVGSTFVVKLPKGFC